MTVSVKVVVSPIGEISNKNDIVDETKFKKAQINHFTNGEITKEVLKYNMNAYYVVAVGQYFTGRLLFGNRMDIGVGHMAQFKDQFLPSLFDRLTDYEPRKKKETQQDRAFDLKQYRQAVLRDVLALLNTSNMESGTFDLMLPENVHDSVLNYGVMPFSGVNFSDIEWGQVEQSIYHALTCFEPRLDAQTLQVNAHVQDENEVMNNKLVIEIKGNLKLNPYPQEFLLRTSMDIETGLFDWVDNHPI